MNQPNPTRGIDQRGFSLIELMVALALGLALVAAVGTLSVNATRSYRAMNRTGEQIENGRYALNLIKSDLEHAGFYGLFNPMNANLALPATVPDPCSTGATLKTYADNLLLHVPPVCNVTLYDRLSGTQRLVLLRASSDIADITSGDTYIQTNPAAVIIGKVISNNMAFVNEKGGDAPGFELKKPDNTAAVIRKLHIHVYYIRTYSQTSGDGIPTLMLKSPIDADSNAQSLLEGIENLQVQYGIDSNGNGSPDAYVQTPSSTLDWSNIVTARLYLLARSVDADPSHTDTKTYDLGNLQVTPGDHYHHRVFSTVVRLINVSQRREQ